MALVKEVMDKQPPIVSPNRTVREAAFLMASRQTSYALVTEGDRPLGVLTARDIVVRVVAAAMDPMRVSVKEVMSTPVYTVRIDDTVEEAAKIMAKFRVRRLVVVDDEGKLAGVITLDVIADMLARERGYKDPILNALCQYSEPPSEVPYM